MNIDQARRQARERRHRAWLRFRHPIAAVVDRRDGNAHWRYVRMVYPLSYAAHDFLTAHGLAAETPNALDWSVRFVPMNMAFETLTKILDATAVVLSESYQR